MTNQTFQPNPANYRNDNPAQPGNVYHWGAGYQAEQFYIIDFYGIRQNMYCISTYCRIFNIKTGRELTLIMRSNRMKNKYYGIRLMTNTVSDQYFSIHRLVSMAFIPKTIEDIQLERDIVNHKNLDGLCNHVWNLEWCTITENNQHAYSNNATERNQMLANLKNPFLRDSFVPIGQGKQTPTKQFGDMRISDEQVHQICQAYIETRDFIKCCEALGLEPNKGNRNVVCNIINGNRRQNISNQYNLNYVPIEQHYYHDLEELIFKLLKRGLIIKEIYDEIKPMIPFKDGEGERQHYDRVRSKIGTYKKKLIKNGLL